MNNKKSPFFPVLIIFLLAVFSFSQVAQGATPNFVTGLGVGNGYKINFANNADGVTWTAGVGGSINATQYTGNASTSNYALTASSVTNATTAGSLAANGTNCTTGNYPLGIDTFGNAEACTAVGGGITIAAIGATANANGMTLTGQQLNLQPASASFGGVITTGAQVLAGVKTFSSQIISTLAAGTAPFAVTSNTLVTNLNADLLDGNHASALSVNYATSAGSATSASTANALAANGANCTVGNYPLGIDASGAVETCTALPAAVNFWGGTKNGTIYNGDAGAGNVGIGTTTPAYKFTLVGTSYLNGQITTSLSGAGNRCLYVDATGNVSAKSVDCGTATGGDNLGDHTATQNILLGNYWLSGDGGNEGVFVSSLGNVGIGLSTPGARLDISGGSVRTTNQFISTLAAGTAPFVLTSNTLVTNLNADLLDGNHASALSVNYATSAGSATSASTANALAANGANCTVGNYPLGIDASGAVETCTALPAYTDTDTQDLGTSGNTITLVNGGAITAPYATLAGSLNANGTNCTAGNYPLGIDAAGNVEACTAVGGGITIAAIGATANANGMTLTGQQLNLQPASASFGGVITTGAQVLAGAKTFSSQIISTLAQGTSPFSVISTTTVTNLSADLLDGLNAASLSVNYATTAGSATSASTATALAANGANCSLGFYPLGVNASGAVETCTAVPVDTDTDTQDLGVSGNTITLVNSAAITAPYATLAGALDANGTNCTAGNYPLGIDADGNVETCTAIPGGLSGLGTINYVSKWSSATGLTNSLIFDNATNVGIATTTPGAKLSVAGGSIQTTNQFISTLAAGTAPFVVTSNTIVTNLNADLLDGQNASAMSVSYAAAAGTATSATNATALSGDGSNCTVGNYPLGIDIAGNVQSCTALPAYTDTDTQDLGTSGNTITLVNGGAITAPYATLAGALDANGTNCTAGNYPLGIDADGNVETCTAIPGGLSGLGTINYVSKWSSATGLTNSLIFDNATNVGIATTTPADKLHVVGSIRTTNQFVSTLAAGTAPFVVTSNTIVTNLNADLLDGQNASAMSVNYATSAGAATSATSASYLGANGANCTAGNYPLGVDQYGAVETCTALPVYTDTDTQDLGVSGNTITLVNGGSVTAPYATAAAALSANGTNCGAGYYTLGVDAAGNAEGCTAIGTGLTGAGTLNRIPKWTPSSSSLGDSAITDDGTTVTISRTSANTVLTLSSVSTGGSIINLAANTGGYAIINGTGSGGNILKLQTGGSDRLTIDATGEVGIGTTAPNSRLEVVGLAPQVLRLTAPSAAAGSSIVFADGGTPTKYNWLVGGQYNKDNGFEITPSTTVGGTTFSTPALVVQRDGNVGIGTVSPVAQMEIYSTTGQENLFITGTQSTGYAELEVRNVAGLSDGVRLMAIGTAYTTIGGFIADAAVLDAESNLSGGLSIMTRAAAPIRFYTAGHATERMRLSATGGLSLGSSYAATDAGANNLIVEGGIAVGLTAPGTYDLNVAGTSLFSNDVTLNKSGGAVLYIAPTSSGSATLSMLSNTGGYSIINADGTTDILKLQTAATDRLSIIANGNVGIGTTAPSAKLMIVANAAGDGFISAAGAATYSPQFSLNNTTTQLGAVGLALSSAHFSGVALANDIVIRATAASSNGNLIITNQNGTGDIKFATGSTNTNDTVKMLISNNGNVGIGSSTPSQKLAVNGNIAAIAFIYTSDRNMKKNIKTLDNSLEKILKLRGVSFNWKENNEESLGLIAQEVEKVYPELVTASVGGKGVQYGNLVAPLIEAVKAQQKEIDTLEARIKVLETKNKRK